MTEMNVAPGTGIQSDRAAVLESVLTILRDVTRDWDVEFSGGITAETRLIADLAFESIDVVQLVASLEEHYQRRDLPFEELMMVEGRYVDDIQVSEIVDFLARHLVHPR